LRETFLIVHFTFFGTFLCISISVTPKPGVNSNFSGTDLDELSQKSTNESKIFIQQQRNQRHVAPEDSASFPSA
jgi:hypothetical protein